MRAIPFVAFVASAFATVGCVREERVAARRQMVTPSTVVPAPQPLALIDAGSDAGAEHAGAGAEHAGAGAEHAAADEDCEERLYDDPPGAFGLRTFQAKDQRFGFKDASGRVVIPAKFVIAYQFLRGGIAAAIDEKVGPVFIDRTGRTIARAYVFDNGPDYFSGGLARIVDNGKVGYIDEQGRIVIAPRWDFATPMCQGRAQACLRCTPQRSGEHTTMVGGAWSTIDAKGNVIEKAR